MLKKLREENNLLQKDLAEYLNCSQMTYSRYECGAREISVDVLIALAKFYKVSANYILGLPKDLPYPKNQ
ncbi:MAG: helix-turn-helix transcriptional regulator [Clostridia bacterium]|nr:helix-turn-helix transcriptional regulator [Clostridia bacterium]